MKQTNRKGFTIVELVIVIAVIAILAAVLIPTFASLINKANRSADIQAVHQMNTLLATYTDGSVENVADAIRALAKENIDLEDYKALQTDHYFYFTVNKNTNTPMVIYADAKDEIVYPEVHKNDLGQWMSLSGEIPLDVSWESKATTNSNGDKSVELENGAQLADLMIKYAAGNETAKSVKSITLTNDIDLKGSTASFGEVTEAISLSGGKSENENYTISGFRIDSNSVLGSYENKSKSYGYALFNYVSANVTIENIDFSNVVIGKTNDDTPVGHSGILVGSVQKGTINISNVNIDNCAVYGGGKSGSIIGYLNGSAMMKNVNVTNTRVLGTVFAAKAVGYVTSEVKELKFEQCNFDGVTTGVNTVDNTFDKMYSMYQDWNGSTVVANSIYELQCEGAPDISTSAEVVDANNKKTVYKFTDIEHRYNGNYYFSYSDNGANDGNKTAYGAYTNDLYWETTFGQKITIDEVEDIIINPSSSSDRTSKTYSITQGS